jgi:dihydroorotase
MKIHKLKYALIALTVLLCSKAVQAQEYDLVIKNGTLIDAKNGINKKMDVAISGGKIAEIASNISAKKGKKVIDAQDKLVTPGLIDLHGHVFFGTDDKGMYSGGPSSVAPDNFTFRSGVTTIVDAGSSGWRNFQVFKENVIDRSKTRVLGFLNIVGSGMKGGVVEQNINDMDPKMTSMTIKRYPELVGVKLAHFSGYDWTPTDRTVEAGTLADVPVMIDFGGSTPTLSIEKLFMEKLRPGDIYTHVYASLGSRERVVDDQGKVKPFVFEAQKRGIVFDVGHGGGSFAFSQAVPAMQQGFKPNAISTDLHIGSMNGGMKDMLNIMSKFINMGMSIEEVIAVSTWKPAEFIKRTELGHLSVGAIADVAILSLQKGDYGFIDTKNRKITGDQKFECEVTLKDGKVVYDLNGLSSKEWDK